LCGCKVAFPTLCRGVCQGGTKPRNSAEKEKGPVNFSRVFSWCARCAKVQFSHGSSVRSANRFLTLATPNALTQKHCRVPRPPTSDKNLTASGSCSSSSGILVVVFHTPFWRVLVASLKHRIFPEEIMPGRPHRQGPPALFPLQPSSPIRSRRPPRFSAFSSPEEKFGQALTPSKDSSTFFPTPSNWGT